MKRHFVQELEGLKTLLIRMSSQVEDSLAQAISALVDRKADLAERVIADDTQINGYELQVDNAIVDLLALQQPVAVDLRFLVAALKMNTSLERIGDHAVNIAESAKAYAGSAGTELHPGIVTMADITRGMLHQAIDGFIHRDPALCREVLRNDDKIDDLNRQVVADLVDAMSRHPETIRARLELMRVSRNLERAADLATNIAEDVIFLAEAHVVKHHHDQNP